MANLSINEIEQKDTWEELFEYIPDAMLIEKALTKLLEFSQQETEGVISPENLHILTRTRRQLNRI